ncbi:MAG TPA: hypothetical protein VK184_03975 [Nostocaceae cyanobacterium]|nr:hypothetical protein [Nostocaceae cyanobacterium]
MDVILHHPGVKELIDSLATGDLSISTEIIWLFITTIFAMIGGAIGGIILAGKELGYTFAATIGSLFAPAGVIPTVILSFLLLNLISNY